MGNKSYRYLAIAAVLLGLMWWFYPRHREDPPPPPAVEVPAQELERPAAPSETETVKPKEPVIPTAQEPNEEDEEPVPPPVSPDEIKALRQQAKATLSGFYSSQRAFYSEFHRYTTDLKAAGWTPNSGAMNYKLGFLVEGSLPASTDSDRSMEDPRRMSTDNFDGEDYTNQERFTYSREINGATLQEYAQYCKSGCTADAETFEIMLIMPLGDYRHIDVWLINEKKELRHVRDGLTGRPPEPLP